MPYAIKAKVEEWLDYQTAERTLEPRQFADWEAVPNSAGL